MENAAEALKMAGNVLMFVLAISVAILSFGNARQTADIILDYRDRETVYIDGDFYYKAEGNERKVGFDTIVPTVNRVKFENYKVVFDFENSSEPIYFIKSSNGSSNIPKFVIDPEDLGRISNDKVSEFLCGILYGVENSEKADFETKYNVSLPNRSLKERIEGKEITEYLGVYYQNDNENEPESNKVAKRIITYKIK